MDILSNLKYSEGSIKKKKRIGRGIGSGTGKTSGKGHNGQRSRAGAKFRAWFEGGQMPLQRRVPKFGFKNINRVEYNVLNLGGIQKLIDTGKITETTVDIKYFLDFGFVKDSRKPLKILGNGELKSKLEISANSFSKSAKDKIENLGGKAIII